MLAASRADVVGGAGLRRARDATLAIPGFALAAWVSLAPTRWLGYGDRAILASRLTRMICARVAQCRQWDEKGQSARLHYAWIIAKDDFPQN